MDSGLSESGPDQFMLSPLVTWVRTFVQNEGGTDLDFSELLDGVFLSDVMTQINPLLKLQEFNKMSRDPGHRVQNLTDLVHQIQTFYLNDLRQLILIPLPNVLLLCRSPYCEESLEEMKKILLLLLGCAVQCEKKEQYIKRIQMLDFDTKAAVAAHIQELTDSQENLLDLQWLEAGEVDAGQLEDVVRTMVLHLKCLLEQRDAHLETIAELRQEREGTPGGRFPPAVFCPSMHQQPAVCQQHLAVELADSKDKIRRLRQELEEKSEQMLDCRQELENLESELKRIQQENSQLLVDARAARAYRDELDALRERAVKADKLQSEVGRYREQLHRMDFFKAKVEELREDNRVLQETKEVLEEQLSGWRSRSDEVHQLEKHNLLLRARLHDMDQEREADQKHLEELQEENLLLRLAQRRSMEESQQLGWELEQLSKTSDSSQGQQSLSEEVSETIYSQMLKLENQSLRRTIEELRAMKIQHHTSFSHTPSQPDEWTITSKTGLNQMLNSYSDHYLKTHREEQEEVESEFHFTGFCIQENRWREDGDSGEHVKELMMKTSQNGLHGFVGSLEHFCCHDNTCSNYTSKHIQRLEATCRVMDSFNQHLQTCLTNIDRKVQRLETEVQELETENQSLQFTQEEHQISAGCLDQLEMVKQNLEQEATDLKREKTRLDKENKLLHQQELVDEKLKTQQRNSDLEQVVQDLEMKVLNQDIPQQEADISRFEMPASSLQRPLQIKDKTVTLEAHLQESVSVNQKLHQALRTVKLSYEALLQRQEEACMTPSSTPHRVTDKAMSELLHGSQEATKELLKLKDHLIKVERNNAMLVTQRQTVQAHLDQLENRCDSQQAQIIVLQRQAGALQENNTVLQTRNANLQVEKAMLISQSASLLAQNAQLQQQQSATENKRDCAIGEREDLRGVHEQLLRDHERLTVLHERQTADYEALIGKYGCLKNVHRSLELEHRSLQDRYDSLQQQNKLEDLQQVLKEEQVTMALEKEQHRTTAAECCRLRDEKDWLNQMYQQLLKDNEALTADHRDLKSQMNGTKLEHTRLEANYSKLKMEYQQLDITLTKLTNQCELLNQLKGNLEEENHHLIGQIQTMVLQNQTLLEQTMENKDRFHVEELQYIEKLNVLRRQKEKLEEKIMAQYKFYQPSAPRRHGSWITVKLKQLIKPCNREHEPERSLFTESHDSGQDSSSVLSSDGSGCSAVSPRHHSTLSSLAFPSMSGDLWGERSTDRKETLTSSSLSILHLHPFTPPCRHLPPDPDLHLCQLTDKDSNYGAAPSGSEDRGELQRHELSGAELRAQSASSGAFSLDGEPCSNGSSPVQQPPSRRSSSSYLSPSDSSTPQHKQQPPLAATPKETATPITLSHNKDLQSAARPNHPEPAHDCWLTRGPKYIRRGSKVKVARCASETGLTVKTTSSKGDATKSSVYPPVTVLYVQGKSSSVSGCLNCFSPPAGKEEPLQEPRCPKILPHASSIISTAEGSSQCSSVHSNLIPAGTLQEPSEPPGTQHQQETANRNQPLDPDVRNGEPEATPPAKPPRDPAVVLAKKPPVQESLCASSFSFSSIFKDTIFSDAAVPANNTPPHKPQTRITAGTQQSQNGGRNSETGTAGPEETDTLLDSE